MNVYLNGRARATDESLQIHHKPCDVFENSMNQRQLIEEIKKEKHIHIAVTSKVPSVG